jgi:hypothetical protein
LQNRSNTYWHQALLASCFICGMSPAGEDRVNTTTPHTVADGIGLIATNRKDYSTIFSEARDHHQHITARVDTSLLQQLHEKNERFVVRGFPLQRGTTADLSLQPFRVAGENTKYVLGQHNGPDRPMAFDASPIKMFTGSVVGIPESRVFLAFSENQSTGRIEMGPGAAVYRISKDWANGLDNRTSRIAVFPARGSARGIDVPLCGHNDLDLGDTYRRMQDTIQHEVARQTAAAPIRGVRTIELALETDFEYFEIFGDADAAAEYATLLIGAVSEIYIRETGHRFELTFVRIWDMPEGLYDQPNGFDAFDAFVTHWQNNMGSVTRDTAQFLSGRRDLPFGGIAYLGVICHSFGYSMAGYILGFFPDPAFPDVYHYDIEVSAHELGHNCNSPHTDAYSPPIDECYPPPSIVQRGTIMSYCSQAVSGGNAVHELRFHARVQEQMKTYLLGRTCVIDDCNMNNIPDAVDIAGPTSVDTNGNGIPDECDDCDGDGTLDPQAIALGAPDVNNNGLPDSCEPDCNLNGIPDAFDILMGTSTDAYGNVVPDSCEPDCNANSVSDFTEIQADLTLDVNRDTILDACEDCDADGITDAEELAGANNLWIASDLSNVVGEYHGRTGVLVKNAEGGWLNTPQDVAVTEGGRILVSSSGDDRVVEFDRAGSYVGDFVAAGDGGLSYPTGLLLRPNGNLLVSNRNGSSVLEYDGATGSSLGAFVTAASGGLVFPFGLVFTPSGNLLVTSLDNRVLEYDGTTGAFVGVFVSPGDNGGLFDARGMAFKPDGNLLVAGFSSNAVHEYDGTTGSYIGVFHNGGTVYGPWGVRVAPNGNIFITRDYEGLTSEVAGAAGDPQPLHATTTRIYEYDPWNGNHLRSYLLGDDTGLFSPTGFAFMPAMGLDCNVNFLPDDCEWPTAATADAGLQVIPPAASCVVSSKPESQTLAATGNPPNPKNRVLSVRAGDAGLTQAIRITSVNNPAPYDIWNGATYWVGEPIQVCENSAQGLDVTPPQCGPAPGAEQRWFWAAKLSCSAATAHVRDWTTLTRYCTGSGEPCALDCQCAQGTCGVDGVIHMYGPGMVPSRLSLGGGSMDAPSTYSVQVIDGTCPFELEDNYSDPLSMTLSAWGDVVLTVGTCPNGPPNMNVDVVGDVVALVRKFANLDCAVSKPRSDLEPCALDMIINITDVLQAVNAFQGADYNLATPTASPCDAAACGS